MLSELFVPTQPLRAKLTGATSTRATPNGTREDKAVGCSPFLLHQGCFTCKLSMTIEISLKGNDSISINPVYKKTTTDKLLSVTCVCIIASIMISLVLVCYYRAKP